MRLYLAWLISFAALLGSIFVEEYFGYIPCDICWYQRVCMFPLVLILFLASYKQSAKVICYIFPQIIIGILLSLYQTLLPMFPSLIPSGICSSDVSCSNNQQIGLGFLSLPILSLLAFALIFFLLLWEKIHSSKFKN